MCSFCTNEIDSTPPPIPTVSSPLMMPLAIVAIAIRPEPHCRSSVMPATLSGSPARSAPWRATL